MLLPVRGAARITSRIGLKDQIDASVVRGDDNVVTATRGGADSVRCDLATKHPLVRKRDPYQLAPVVRHDHRLVVEEADRLRRAAPERDGVEDAAALEL